MNVSFLHFTLDESISTCTVEKVEITDGNDENIATLCGSRDAEYYLARSHTVDITYRNTGATYQYANKGFTVLYQPCNYRQIEKETYILHSLYRSQVTRPLRMHTTDAILLTVITDFGRNIEVSSDADSASLESVYIADGPSKMAENLTLERGVDMYKAVSSSFIVLIDIILDWQNDSKVNHSIYIKSVSKDLVKWLERWPEIRVASSGRMDRIISSPVPTYRMEVQAFHLIAHQNTYLDVSVTKMVSYGPTSNDCRFWGLAIYDPERAGTTEKYHPIIAETLNPLFLLCKLIRTDSSHERIALPNRYISRRNQIIILWYAFGWLNNYFDISLSTKISKCQGAFMSCRIPLSSFNRLPRSHDKYRNSEKHSVPISERQVAGQSCSEHSFKVWHSNGKQCIKNDRFGNYESLVGYYETNCMSIQYILSYISEQQQTSECFVTAQYRKQAQLHSTVIAHHQNCRQFKNLTLYFTHAHTFYIDSKCTSFTFRSSIVRFIPSHIKSTLALNDPFKYLEDVNEESFYYTHALQHSATISSQMPTIAHSITHTDMVRRRDFSSYKQTHIMDNITRITVKSNCLDACVGLAIIYTVPASSGKWNRFWHHYLQKRNVCMQQNNVGIALIQYSLYMFRNIELSDLRQTSDEHVNRTCNVTVTTNPYLPISKYLSYDSWSAISQGLDTIGLQKRAVVYIVHWERLVISWKEAEERCQVMGGHLPSFSTPQDLELLDHLMLGSLFHRTQVFISPLRLHPYSGVYIGLNYTKVSINTLFVNIIMIIIMIMIMIMIIIIIIIIIINIITFTIIIIIIVNITIIIFLKIYYYYYYYIIFLNHKY